MLVEGEAVPPYCAGEGARGDGLFGRVEDVGGGAGGALGGGGFAVDGAEEDGGPFEGGVGAGGEGLDARWGGGLGEEVLIEEIVGEGKEEGRTGLMLCRRKDRRSGLANGLGLVFCNSGR